MRRPEGLDEPSSENRSKLLCSKMSDTFIREGLHREAEERKIIQLKPSALILENKITVKQPTHQQTKQAKRNDHTVKEAAHDMT